MIAAGVLIRDAKPCYYVYRLTWRDRDADRARRRRLDRRLRDQPHPQARADDAGQGGRPRPPDRGGQRPDRAGDDRLSGRARDRRHAGARGAGAAGGRRHRRRRRAPPACGWSTTRRRSRALTRAFDALPALYIADGHHRSAAAARVARCARRPRRLARLFPLGDLSASPDDHPRLQPRAADLNGRSAGRSCWRRCASASRWRRRISRCGPRRPASSACISPAAGTG